MAFEYRDAEVADLPAILAIYNHAVLTSFVTWDTQPRSLAAQQLWFEQKQAGNWPVRVAMAGGEVVAYGSFGPFRPFEGYAPTVEHSIYVREDQRGQGLGKAMLAELLALARAQGRHMMIAALDADNTASLALHARFGFVETARMPELGLKQGQWRTLVMLQRAVNEQDVS